MKVFISWSGDMSKELGEALRNWIPAVIQQVKPYFTPNDIEKGTRWSTDIASELNESKIGIICLTKDNLEKPWVMFEAGALSKQLDSSHVCPILFDLDSSDLKGPLVQFQATPFNKSEIKKLISIINKLLGENKLDESVLNSVFDMWWPKLEEQIKGIISKHKTDGRSTAALRDEREILEEILALTRMSAKRSSPRTKSKENEIEPEAFIFLARKYFEICSMSQRYSIPDDLANEITSLKGVIEYISRRGARDSEEYDEIMSLLEMLDESYPKE